MIIYFPQTYSSGEAELSSEEDGHTSTKQEYHCQ